MTLSKETRKLLELMDANKLLILRNLYLCTDEICGSDLISELGISKNLLSYHIKQLRDSGFIQELKTGRRKHYSINPENLQNVKELLISLKIINE